MLKHLAAALLIIGVPMFAAAPAVAAEATLSNEDLQIYGQWVSKALQADAPMHEEFARVSPRLSQIMQRVREPGGAKAAAAELSAIVDSIRPVLQLSQAELKALAPLAEPKDGQYPFPTRKLKEDFLATGTRIIGVLDSTSGLANALAAGDRVAADRHAAALKTSATLLIDGQILLVRARKAAIPEGESTHQAIGLMEVLYQAMGVTMAQRFETGPWPAARLRQLAGDASKYVADGQATLKAELRELENTKGANSSDRKLLASAKAVALIDQETFALGTELAAALETAAAGNRASAPALLRELVAMEMRFQTISQRQADTLAASQ